MTRALLRRDRWRCRICAVLVVLRLRRLEFLHSRLGTWGRGEEHAHRCEGGCGAVVWTRTRTPPRKRWRPLFRFRRFNGGDEEDTMTIRGEWGGGDKRG